MKTEVYSWRLSAAVKADLEREARVRKVPVSKILEAAVQNWLNRSSADGRDVEAQRRLRTSMARCLGVLSGNDPRRSETVREAVRERLRRRYAR